MRATEDDSTPELLSALIGVVTAWTSVRTQGRIAEAVGVVIPENDVRGLYTLGLIGVPVRPARLADELHLTRPTTSKMIARLVEAGLVERSASAHDGRGAVVSLSVRGRAAHAGLVEAGLRIIDAALRGTDADGAVLVTEVLQRIVDELPGLSHI